MFSSFSKWRKHPAVIICGLVAATWLLNRVLMVEGALDDTPYMAAFAMLVLALCSQRLPQLARIQPRSKRTLCSLLICWLWGIALMVLTGSFIDCFASIDSDAIIIIPFAILMPTFGLFGILPALIPYWIIENKAD